MQRKAKGTELVSICAPGLNDPITDFWSAISTSQNLGCCKLHSMRINMAVLPHFPLIWGWAKQIDLLGSGAGGPAIVNKFQLHPYGLFYWIKGISGGTFADQKVCAIYE